MTVSYTHLDVYKRQAYRKKFSYASDLEWDVIMKAIRRLYNLCEKGISL